jgi:hypothetical protein
MFHGMADALAIESVGGCPASIGIGIMEQL